ncbi:GNAT family N-acetyltransferase [Maribacter sp. CXY002]|uniref:GNAT family N-acetyltransferase n=1 Tax=Maribacter luteocoastalis TaxID=3407671 RepID=UPI003B67D7AF
MLETSIKKFSELELEELYHILQLRSAVFVVEQDCVYQDMDGKDKKAIHILGRHDGKLVAYTRIFDSGDYFNEASIGRVVVDFNYRKFGYGKVIMEASIKAINNLFNQTDIKISAQLYLKKFYNDLGFIQFGESYLEDGIPHIGMLLN